MSQSDQDIIREALEHLAIMHAHRQRGDIEDILIVDGICLQLAAAIESLSRLPEEKRLELLGDDWRAIWATRNRIAHAYVHVNANIILASVDNEVPLLVDVLTAALEVIPEN